jgi:methyl-accepting chemotaxis protein
MKGVNEMLDAILLPIGEGNRILEQISGGKIDELITQQYKGDHEKMKLAVNNVGQVVQSLTNEMTRLIKASREGMLSERGKADQFKGAFADLMKGINEMLDAIVKPLIVSADYVERISAGNIPPKITDNYNGDFNKIKNNLNTCIDSINALVADGVMLAQAGVDGKLSTRADATKHQGDYRKIINGLNGTLESVAVPVTRAVEHLEKLSRGETPPTVTNKYNGDIQKLADGFNSLFETIHRLVDDAGMLYIRA